MKKIILILITLFYLTSCHKSKVLNYDKDKINAIWFSYIDYRENLQNLSKKEFTKKVKEIIKNIQTININTIYLHTTSFTDAFYDSKIYHKSLILGNINYDPLKIFINEAHKKGIRIEAWINPLRSIEETEINSLSDDLIIKKWINENKPYIKLFKNRYYLNPSYEEVNELVISVVKEVLSNYNVDGIHLDDYFYPEGIDENFDKEIYVQKTNNLILLSDFRKNNINSLVSLINKVVKKRNLVFGISPSGNKDYSINAIYADVDMWIDAEVIDYIAPQIYWGYNHPIKAYIKTLKEWNETVSNSNVDLIIGLAAYKIGKLDNYAKEGQNEWIENDNILSKQKEDTLNIGLKGISYFSYNSLFNPEKEIKDKVLKEIENLKR